VSDGRTVASAVGEWGDAEALLLPTAPIHPTIAEVAADPVGVNALVGTYTNFCNLFGVAAVAVPAGETSDGPLGVQVITRGFADVVAAGVAALLTGEPAPAPAAAGLRLLVVGAHLTGQPLNGQLTTVGGSAPPRNTACTPCRASRRNPASSGSPPVVRASRARCGSCRPPRSARSSPRCRNPCSSGRYGSPTNLRHRLPLRIRRHRGRSRYHRPRRLARLPRFPGIPMNTGTLAVPRHVR
jgi:hypothetical protein